MIKVTEHELKLDGQRYFRGNAHMLELGSCGEFKNPIGPRAYIDPQLKVKREHLLGNRVTKGRSVSIDFSKSSKAEFGVDAIDVFGLGVSAAASLDYKKATEAKLELYSLYMVERQLKQMLNNDANGARKYLKEEGKDARIVSEIWVVMKAELATHFDTSSRLIARAMGDDLSIIAAGGGKGSQTIELSPGAVFAYKTHKVKKWNGDKVEDLEADYKGLS